MPTAPRSDVEAWRQFFCAAITGLSSRQDVSFAAIAAKAKEIADSCMATYKTKRSRPH